MADRTRSAPKDRITLTDPSRPISPPATEAELLVRARAVSGSTLGDIAAGLGVETPLDQRRAKGFTGLLLERALGATASSRAQPDFEPLGIELKTLPVDLRGRPRESTFVCTIPLTEIGEVEWEQSRVRRKLSRVLWMPIEADPNLTLAARRIGTPLLWSPDPDDERDLRFDWEELAGLIGRGQLESITGHMGRFLQIRPKAASSRARRRGVDRDGAFYSALPRGFYLRPAFTGRILERNYALPR
jgi:DNA mismatch repair protein MutH